MLTETFTHVSQVRGGKWRIIAGPFETRELAESKVDDARAKVIAQDPWSHFDAFGVCRK